MLCVGLCAEVVAAGDDAARGDRYWPQWRGPLGTGAAVGDPPVTWSRTENVRWRAAIPGRGHATPIIWADRVFLLTAIASDEQDATAARSKPDRSRGRGRGIRGRVTKPQSVHKFDVLCLDRKSGKVLWQRTVREEQPHEGHFMRRGSLASGSPVTDGTHLYAWFGSRGLYCYDFDGNQKWKADPGRMHMRNAFGEGSSPALHGDTIVLNMDQEDDSFIVAVDKRTGKVRWKKPREEGSSWSTPLVVAHDGKPQAVLPATNAIRSYDLATGALVWQCGWESRNVVPTPVFGHGLVFLMTGHRMYSLKAIRLGATGDVTDTDAVVWNLTRGTPYVPSPLLHGNELYLLRDKGFLSCYDARTGKPHYELQRLSGAFSASPVAAGGRIYMASEDGDIVVAKLGKKFEILATNEMDETFFASPAIVGNELFLRSDEALYCIGG